MSAEQAEVAAAPAAPVASGSQAANAPEIRNHTGSTKASVTSGTEIALTEEEKKWSSTRWQDELVKQVAVPIDKSRAFFEKILKVFPLAGKVWVQYATAEQNAGNLDRVEKIISRTLLTISSMELWIFYLNFVKTTKLDKALQSEDAEQIKVAKEAMVKAFDFALDRVGFAQASGPIWKQYLAYLDGAEAESEYFKTLKVSGIRKVYARALVTPVQGIDDLWSDYEAFENAQSAATATVQLGELQQKYMQARSILRERKDLFDPLASLSGLLPERFQGSSHHNALLAKWRSYIAFEQSNPERVIEAVELKKRVRFAFDQALCSLQFFPELWYDYASYEHATGDVDRAREILNEASRHVPKSLFLKFAAADFEERTGNARKARRLFDEMMEHHPCPLVFIQFQRFARRAEGVAAARKVFRQARGRPECDGSVYVAAALLEWRINKQADVARNVFELGMRSFSSDPDFLIEYLRFLMGLNQENDARALFERAVVLVEGPESLPIWELYREFEAQWADSDLGGVEGVERRLRMALPEHGGLHGMLALSHRYTFAGVMPPTETDLLLLNRVAGLSSDFSTNVDQKSKAAATAAAGGGRGGTGAGATAAEDDVVIPPFLRRLVDLLPTYFRGTPPDPDFALRSLRDKRLPDVRPADNPSMGMGMGMSAGPGPGSSAGGLGPSHPEVGGKRAADSTNGPGPPDCAFHLRQKMMRPELMSSMRSCIGPQLKLSHADHSINRSIEGWTFGLLCNRDDEANDSS